jgi:hypothetical protein
MKTDIEYAAMVMGDAVKYKELSTTRIAEFGLIKHTKRKGFYVGVRPFDPEHDDGDSRRLEIACFEHLHATRTAYEVERTEEVLWLRECYGSGKPERVREAVFALALAIGKVIEGNDNAG